MTNLKKDWEKKADMTWGQRGQVWDHNVGLRCHSAHSSGDHWGLPGMSVLIYYCHKHNI